MNSETFTDMKDISVGFLRYFSGALGVSGDLQQFHSAKWEPGESVRNYKHMLSNLATRLDIPDSLLKDRFINSLSDHFKFQILPFYNKSFDDIFEIAQQMVSVIRNTKSEAAANMTKIADIKSEFGNLTTLVTNLSRAPAHSYSSAPVQTVFGAPPHLYPQSQSYAAPMQPHPYIAPFESKGLFSQTIQNILSTLLMMIPGVVQGDLVDPITI